MKEVGRLRRVQSGSSPEEGGGSGVLPGYQPPTP